MASNVNPITGTITDDLNSAWSYVVGQCTRFVAGALSWIPPGLGNARDWLGNAQRAGLPTIGPTSAPPVGSVAVWGTGQFGHVAEVVGRVPGGFQVAEENFLGGPFATDVRTVAGAGLGGLEGFILPPGGVSNLPVVGGLVGGAEAAASLPQAIAGLPGQVGHGLANAAGASFANVGTWFRNQLVPLLVALVVVIVLFGGDESRQS